MYQHMNNKMRKKRKKFLVIEKLFYVLIVCQNKYNNE